MHKLARRVTRLLLGGALAPSAVALVVAGAPRQLGAQTVVPCDFDVDPNTGRFMSGGVLHLTGQPGSSSNAGQFVLVNGTSAVTDVERDGYALPGTCNYGHLYLTLALTPNLVNVANRAYAIPARNIIVTSLPHSLPSGTSAYVDAYVSIPLGTPAGRYVGAFEIRDSVVAAATGPNGVALNVGLVNVEVTVGEAQGIAVVNADTTAALDSLVLRMNTGRTATGVFRVANVGNVAQNDIRFSASDLRSESAVGMVIPAENVAFSAPSLASIGMGDTARVSIRVTVPRGLLGGRYRGTINVQGGGTAATQIPLVVVVSTGRGIVFENNPVRTTTGGIARIAFNGDPGTTYEVAIMDMAGLLVYQTTGTIFAGQSVGGVPGTAAAPASGADFAAAVPWPLVNGRNEPVASGMYLVVVQSVVNGQRQLAKDKLMVIR